MRHRARESAAALIVHFLEAVGEAHGWRVVQYMESTPLAYTPETTRNVLSRLTRAGRIARVAYGRYRWVDVPPAELETKPAALTTTLG